MKITIYSALGALYFVTSCGRQEVIVPGGSAFPLVETRETLPEERKTRIPGFVLPTAENPSSSIPAGPVLLEHWDEIQKQIMARPAGMRRDGLIAQSIGQMVYTDPKRAAQLLKDWKNAVPSHWIRVAKMLVKQLWKTDPAAGVDFLATNVAPSMQGALWHEILAELPAAEAAGWIESISHEGGKLRAAATVMVNWPRENPEAAAAWMDRFAATLNRAQLEVIANPNYFVSGLSPTQLPLVEGARRAFEAARQPAARRFFADRYLRYVKHDRPGQLAEITTQVEAELASSVAKGFRYEIALSQMKEDPKGYVAALTPEELEALPDRFLSETVSAWGEKDSPAAARWALSLNRENDVVSGVDRWAGHDPKAAMDFVLALPAGGMRNKSLAQLCEKLGWTQNFEMAQKCLEEIRDAEIAKVASDKLETARDRIRAKK